MAIKTLVLYMHDYQWGFHFYSDTSKFAMSSALYQIQNGQPKLIAYVSKRMPSQFRITL